VPANSSVVQGIDVSSHQGAVDWQAVGKGNLSFAYVRATIGAHTPDLQFAGNWSRISKTKLLRGANHFFLAARRSGRASG
jgi:lysozyme